MTEPEDSSDYARWVTLANDPSQSEEARQDYRRRMESHLRCRLREAFEMAARRTLRSPRLDLPKATPDS